MKQYMLNLGSGEFKKEGFINVDVSAELKPDLVWNLDDIPYPFRDNIFKLITADHCLEHLREPFLIMKEWKRILAEDGKLIIRVPHYSRGFTHADHKRGFDVSFPLYFNKGAKGFFAGTDLKLESMKLKWFAQPYLKKITLSSFQYYTGTILGKIFSFLANLSPYMCSRIWCFWVGGFEEIEFMFVKPKKEFKEEEDWKISDGDYLVGLGIEQRRKYFNARKMDIDYGKNIQQRTVRSRFA